MNLMMLLEMASSAFGERVAFGSKDGSGITYQELYERAGKASQYFKETNAEHVSFLAESNLGLPISLFGSSWAGLPFVPLNYRLAADEVQALADRISPTVPVTNNDLSSIVQGKEGVSLVTGDQLIDITTAGATPDPSWNMDPEEIAILLFTSGTTGAPKVAV